MWCTRPYCRRLVLALLVGVAPAWSQSRLMQQGNDSRPTGVGLQPQFDLEMVSPVVHEWYAPQHLFENQVRPWYVSDTQYARETYLRYVNQLLEGFEHFDTFGRPLGRGWLVYNWQHVRNQRNGSLIEMGNAGGRARLSSLFQNLVVSSDTDGRSIYRMSVGDGIFTRFTPLTFYKPLFNGVRLDFANDRIEGTMLLARPSQPNGVQTNITHLIGGHGKAQMAANATLGLTYVSAYSTRTDLDFDLGNPLNGIVPSRQDQPVQKLWVRIRDDSPEDLVGGGRLFRHEIVLEDTSGQIFRGRDIGLLPAIEGGRLVDGALVTDGSETAVLLYDLAQLSELPALQDGQLVTSAVRRATVELSLANDYQVEMASDRQSDGDRFDPEIVFLPVRRADGNVQDQSNSRQISIDFGFPTANELIGIDWDLVHWRGLSIQGEAVLNRRHQKYPGPRQSQQYHFVRESTAAYTNAAYSRNPWLVFVEVFAIEDGYSTSHWITETNKGLAFKADIPQVYEFVDDDDDNNAVPEWIRPFQNIASLGQQETVQELPAWPGYDENRDFIYDHNQNRNLVPDYDEPFLRFRSDRPEFLFGMDMNHNATVDRFENDDQADYPYKRDHRGYNVYTRLNAGPDASLTLGRQRMELISGDGRTRSVYALGTWVQELGSAGRLRVFDFGAWVRDDIADHLRLWVQPLGTVGRMRDVRDGLAAMDTWRNTFYADWDQRIGGLRSLHRLKWERWWQRDSKEQVAAREGRRLSGFTGVINKAEWSIPIGLGLLEPRFKSEYRSDRPFTTRLSTARSIEETVFLLWTQPLFAEHTSVNYYARYGKQIFDTEIQAGLEVSRLWMIDGRREDIDQGFSGQTVVFQLVNRVAYQGYQVVSRSGFQFTRRKLEDGARQDSNLAFMTINAGLR